MTTNGRHFLFLSLGLALVASPAGCKKKPKDKSPASAEMAPAMDTMARPATMRPMGRAAMTPRRRAVRPRPKKLSFAEQLKRSIPVTPKPADQSAGKVPLKAELCKVEGATFLAPSNMGVLKDIVFSGGRVYVLNAKGAVLAFKVAKGKGCTLTLDKAWGKDGVLQPAHRVAKLAADKRGNLVLSSFMGITRLDKAGKPLPKCTPGKNGSVALHPSGSWGLAYFVNATVFLAKFSPKTCSGKPWVLQDLSKPSRKGEFTMVNTIGFYRNLVLVGGVHKDKVKGFNPRVVVAYTKAGKKKFQFGRAEGFGQDKFGWVHGIAEGKKVPIWVLDSNYRRLSAWDAKGKFQGAVQLAKLFGVHYPWIASLSVTPKGDGWFVVGVSRTFKEKAPKGARWSVGEGFIFHVTGL